MNAVMFCSLLILVILGYAAFAVPELALVMILPALVILLFVMIPRAIYTSVERSTNKTRKKRSYSVREESADLHRQLFIADLHADTLLWNRNILVRHRYGHIDLPRLVDGHVALQVFGAVTQAPAGLNNESNRADNGDLIKPLVALQGWPMRTWGSPLQRALFQAKKLEWFSSHTAGRQLLIIRSMADLKELIERHTENPVIIGGLLGLEGAQALEGRLANLDLLFDAGYRMFGLSFFFDNEVCGSAHGVEKGGLTGFGREVIKQAEARGMIIDLAHSSPKTIEDVLEASTTPVVVSHTGVRGTCDNPRNLSDEHVRRIASSGGVIGISMFEMAVGETTIEATARAMRYTADLAGAGCLALGSDFDGMVATPIDASDLVLLTDALVEKGFTNEEITGIMGGNFLRLLQIILPKETAD
jgi:membrane dipeptidase